MGEPLIITPMNPDRRLSNHELKVRVYGTPGVTVKVALVTRTLTPASGLAGACSRSASKAKFPVAPAELSFHVAARSGTSGVQEVMPHSKSPLGTTPTVGVGHEVVVVEVATVVGQVGPQEQAEEYLAGSVPQAEVARMGVVVVRALTAVSVKQKSMAVLTAAGEAHGNKAR